MTTTLLCILDGLGINPNPVGNAVHLAKKPTIDNLLATSPNATLVTFGERVGLPEGQMGNSEVGHLNIGAGREVEQWLLKISRALRSDSLTSSAPYQNFLQHREPSGAIHLVGLYSSGGVHSERSHLHLLIERIVKDCTPAPKIVLHLISDGRDVSPHSFKNDIATLIDFLKGYPTCVIGSVSGRFFAMDRDNRWERVEKAYNAMFCGVGNEVVASSNYSHLIEYIEQSYKDGVTDEFLEPAVIMNDTLQSADSLIFWNFRTDRMRELVAAIASPTFDGFKRGAIIPAKGHLLCFTEYDSTFGFPYLFEQEEIKNHLGEVVASHGLKQLRVAETEKYPHVTYFLNGGIETPYAGEDRNVVPSPRDVATYDLKPEMSAYGVTEVVVEGIRSNKYDLIIVNIANCDMVGHTGVLEAGIKAVETADNCLGQMLRALETNKGKALVIADHGNAEMMINYSDGSPHTSHTTFPVPVIMVDYSGLQEKVVKTLRHNGALSDVAPTILKMMGVAQPKEMTGTALF